MKAFVSLISKDVKEETRRPHEPLALASLAAAFALPISYLISGSGSTITTIVSAANLVVVGQISLSILITSLLGFLLIIRESERGTIYALKLAPLAPELMFIAKVIVLFIFMVPLSLVYTAVVSFLSSTNFITINF